MPLHVKQTKKNICQPAMPLVIFILLVFKHYRKNVLMFLCWQLLLLLLLLQLLLLLLLLLPAHSSICCPRGQNHGWDTTGGSRRQWGVCGGGYPLQIACISPSVTPQEVMGELEVDPDEVMRTGRLNQRSHFEGCGCGFIHWRRPIPQ